MARAITYDGNGRPTSVKYTRETNTFTLAVKHQTGPSPEQQLAGAVIESALRDILKYGGRRNPLGYLHLDAAQAAAFLLKPNPLLWQFCDWAGLNMSFVVKLANEEVKRFNVDLTPQRKIAA